MQRIIHQYQNSSRLFSMLEGVYAYISEERAYEDVLWLDNSFKALCDILESNLYLFTVPKLKHFDYEELPHKSCDAKEVVVLLSGGKDSAAAAYYYKKRGYDVHLYHAEGINKAYGDEKKAAQRIADYLGCDLFIDKLLAYGTHPFIEHPMKNYAIANGAIHYALREGFAPTLVTGNFNKSYLDLNEFEVCGGDCVEMWDAYEDIIRRIIPDFSVQLPLETNADTFKLLLEDTELLNLAVSCMSPYRFREHWKHRTEEKYNVRLLQNRCGCCWKCCIEAMWLMDIGRMDYNEEYYKHCIEILEKTIIKETGTQARSIHDLWENYIFYPMEQSKGYDWLSTYITMHRGRRVR